MSGHIDRDAIADLVANFVVHQLGGEDGSMSFADEPVASVRMGADRVDVFVRMADLG